MEIAYRIELADLLAFARYDVTHSPQTRQSIRRQQLVIGGGMILFGAALSAYSGSLLTVGLMAVWAALFCLWMPGHLRRFSVKQYERRYLSGRKESREGSMRLFFDGDDSLGVQTDESTSTLKLASIEQIAEDEGYAYLYVNAMSAIVVPRHSVSQEKFEGFIAELRRRREAQLPGE